MTSPRFEGFIGGGNENAEFDPTTCSSSFLTRLANGPRETDDQIADAAFARAELTRRTAEVSLWERIGNDALTMGDDEALADALVHVRGGINNHNIDGQ